MTSPTKADRMRAMFASQEWHQEGPEDSPRRFKTFSYETFKLNGLYACAYVGDVQYFCSIIRRMGYRALVGDWAVYVYDRPPATRKS